MLIPEVILEKQLCSTCRKYLSITPIKVYPNRQVNCGRCSLRCDDIGVVSKLYSTVLQYMLFPCINKYAGCNVQENLQEMKFHEDICMGYSNYECLICEQFKGTAFHLKDHCISVHQKKILQLPMFFIDLSEPNHNNFYVYMKENIIAFVVYAIDSEKIELDVLFPADMYNGEILHQFIFCSGEDALLKTKPTPCSQLQYRRRRRPGAGVYIDRSNLISEDKKIMCQFHLAENRISTIKENCIESNVLNPTSDTGIFRYRFNHLSKLDNLKDHHIPGINYILNIPLRVSIYFDKDKFFSNDICSFLVFLMREKSYIEEINTCTFDASCTLRSSMFINRQSVKNEELNNDREILLVRDISNVFNLQNDSLDVKVLVKVYLPKPNTFVCKRAQIQCDCPNCGDEN